MQQIKSGRWGGEGRGGEVGGGREGGVGGKVAHQPRRGQNIEDDYSDRRNTPAPVRVEGIKLGE